MSQQTVLITGASSGIGLSLAKVFAKNNYNIIITARKQEDLEKAAEGLRSSFGADVKIFVQDLAKHESPKQLFDWCNSQNIVVDILVNNAGFADYEKFANSDLKLQLGIVDLNIRAVTELTHLFLPQMVSKKNGKILNVASTAAFQPGPLWIVYAASKAYILSFSQGLRNELKGTGVYVTALCPGATKTNFQNVTKGFSSTNLLKNGRMMNPDVVAEAGYRALMKNKSYVIPGFMNSLMALGSQVAPRNLVTAIARRLMEKSN